MFSALTKWVSSGKFLTAALTGGAIAYGANRAADANEEAARIAAQSAQQQAATIRESNRLAQQRYEDIQAQTAPAVAYQNRILAQDPNVLSGSQQQQMEDARRNAKNTLAASGLSGAGRTVTSSIRNVESDLKNRLIDSNKSRSDQTASGLSSQYYNAAGNSAALDQSTGAQVAGTQRQAGDATANAGLANASLTGAALGDIVSVVNQDLKRQGRASSYGNDENTKKVGEA